MTLRLLPVTALVALAGCGTQQNVDPSKQVGPSPVLPEPAGQHLGALTASNDRKE